MDTYPVKLQTDLQELSATHDKPVNPTIYILQFWLINNALEGLFPLTQARSSFAELCYDRRLNLQKSRCKQNYTSSKNFKT